MRPAPIAHSFASARGHRIEIAVDDRGDLIVRINGADLIASDRREIERLISKMQAARFDQSRDAVVARARR